MLKRLIEVALPLKEVSEQSAREKSIRHGHISTLHIWWARRPLAACRAVVFASLIPDPDDPECPDSFRTLVNDLLPQTPNGEDTPRSRCLEFIKHLVKWENSNNEELIGKARKLIAAAHKFLHPDADGDMPKVLDPFAGGGAIPLEALRLGCEAHAIDINPVAHIIELCTLVYPQKYGQPNIHPTPDYIKKLEVVHEGKDGEGLFSKKDEKEKASGAAEIDGIALTRLPLITDAEYQKNPLAADVKFWGHWVLEKARDEIGQFFPHDSDGSAPVAYLWARTVKSPNPACAAFVPLLRQLWLCNRDNRRVALRMNPNAAQGRCEFAVVEGTDIDFDASEGTMKRGQLACPFTGTVMSGEQLRQESKAGKTRKQLVAVVTVRPGQSGKHYRAATEEDVAAYQLAVQALNESTGSRRSAAVPNESITPDRPSPNSRGLSCVVRYGIDEFGKLFNERQTLVLTTVARAIGRACQFLHKDDHEFGRAVQSYLSIQLSRLADYNSMNCVWHSSKELVAHTFGRQSLPMVWDFVEINTFGDSSGNWKGSLDWILRVCKHCSQASPVAAYASQGSATHLAYDGNMFDAVVTDPPYYDAVPYADLSDFFYVWLKRVLADAHPQQFRTPLTPKSSELIAYWGTGERQVQKTPSWYEDGMTKAFAEMRRTLGDEGVCGVMFAHKTTSAWESIIRALTKAGFVVQSSWPIHTELTTGMVKMNKAMLASSILLACRRRADESGTGFWDDVRNELREVARERLDFFWKQGIRGADFFISAIGPALSVYGRYAKVTRLTGEEVSVGQFLDEVRGIVTDYALSQILHGAKTGQIDSETRFYVLWKWSYGDGKVAADEAFKLSQALGIDTEEMWDRAGVLEKQGQNVQALTVAKRMRIKDLGEPNVDGSPATLIDTLHRCCAFRDKGDTGGLSEYLARSGHGRNEKLWTVAQAISEVLPDGDKEKQLLQGLLNQRDKIDELLAEGRLF